MSDAPWMWIIGGPNGAGKTTLAHEILGNELNTDEFLNVDEVARTLSPHHPEKVRFTAGKAFLHRLESLIAKRKSLAVETTLSSLRYVERIHNVKQEGWYCGLLFIWLESAELAMERVSTRVASGGHDVPEVDVRRRYARCMANLKRYIDICDKVLIFNNSHTGPKLIAQGQGGELEILEQNNTLDIFQSARANNE